TAVGTFDTKDSGTGKTVTISGIVKSGASKDNYTISVPTSGTANITPAAITVTPDVLTKVYGQNDPALTYRITVGALVASETLVGSLARVTGENVGQYEITQGTVTNDGNPNYNITFTTGIKLTITQATPEITLTSNKVAGYAVYGDPVTFTATAHQSGSGSVPAGSVQFWLDSEKLGSPVMLTLGSASYSTTQTDLLVGDRSVTAEFIPDTGEINYITNTSVAYVISIGKREVTIKADDKTIYVGDLIPKANSLTYTVDGLIGGDSLLTPPTLSLPIDVSSSVAASYTIMVTGAGVSDKYTLNIINGTLRVIQPEMEADTTPSELSQTILVWASAQTSKIAAASVTADQISQAISAVMRETPQEDASPFVEITLQNAGYVNTVKITVPKAAVDYLEQNGLGLQLNTPIGTITFNADALSVISQNAGGNINFQIKRLDPASLPETVRAAVGDRPVYDFTVTSGNGIVSSFGGENITVKVPYDIKDGENPNAIVVYYIDDDGNMTPVCGGYNPEERAVYFTIAHLSQYAIVYNEVTYTDVPQSAWYYNAVTFCAARGITTGLGNGFFGPNDPLTRGQFIVLLMRAYGLTIDEKPIDNFSDAGDTYYTGYLASAKRLGITTGVGSNMFMPDEVITRQDMFTLLYRVLAVLGQLPEMKEDASLSSFADADKISDYAKDAMENLISAGIVSGSGGNLDPLGISTRAQMAQLLYKLLT
ncbi:MAG: S-layer homology domain-containing protein, partial [Clostridiaceae bacterium]|nr:S-layer homology domain-containing protein [Clostridiaceae bacterium]